MGRGERNLEGQVTVPLYMGPPEKTIFGWYHSPAPAGAGGARPCGVVLCNPVGDDYVRAHRPLRHLAERLARAGFPVLRFDFHGTGDSSGDEREAGRAVQWRGDVLTAIDELRSRSGVPEVALVGLRLGATLAMLAGSEAGHIASLVLWNPYLSGKAFVTESTRQHSMHRMLEPESFSGGPKVNPAGQEALGFLLTHEVIADLGRLDLLMVGAPPARRVLLITGGNQAGADRLVEHLREIGAEAEARQIDGLKFLTMINHRAVLPTEEMDQIVAWLSEHHPPAVVPAALPAQAPRRYHDISYEGAPLREQVLRFGEHQRLFGVLVRARPQPGENGARQAALPGIIMLNAGTVHRIGPHRFYVTMARLWASLGFPVLRVDLSGIGDSPSQPGSDENLCYPPSALADIDAAMEALTAAAGVYRFIVMGLCSGGDLAFKKGLADERVAGAVIMNPRTFCVNDLDLVSAYQQARYYQESLWRPRSWAKALRGNVDFRRVMRLVLPKAKSLLQSRVDGLIRRLRGLGRGAPAKGRPPAPTISSCLQSMAERGVDTFLLVTLHDPGVDYVDAHEGPAMAALRALPTFRREDVKGTDHTFTSEWAQHHVTGLLTEHLQRRHLP